MMKLYSSYLIINLKDRSVNRVSSLSNLYLLKNNNQINNVLEKFFNKNLDQFNFINLIPEKINNYFKLDTQNLKKMIVLLTNTFEISTSENEDYLFIKNCYQWIFDNLWYEFSNYINYHRLICLDDRKENFYN